MNTRLDDKFTDERKPKMKKYIAVMSEDGKGRILSVGAENEAEARTKIIDQLSRPGRYEILNQWKSQGAHVISQE